MLRNIKNLLGCILESRDGYVGKVDEFYFEVNTWEIQYLIIKTGDLFYNRKLRICPRILVKEDTERGKLLINFGYEQIKNLSISDLNKPELLHTDDQIDERYPLQRKGKNDFPFKTSGDYTTGYSILGENNSDYDNCLLNTETDDSKFRSVKKLNGFSFQASGEDIGHVSDFILDVAKWEIISLVIDSHNWFGGKKLLIATGSIKEIQWNNSVIILNISRSEMKNCPEFDEVNFKYFQSSIQ